MSASAISDASAPLAELGPRTAQGLVADRLRTEILAGLIAPGTKLPQSAVATRMRTSTTPVREALRELAVDGLLDGDPHRGFVVHRPTLDEFLELYEIRLLLEPATAVKAAARIAENDLDAAADLIARMDDEENAAKWALLNRDFHELLGNASRSPLLSAVTNNLRDRAAMYVAISVSGSRERLRASNQQHREILDACRIHDRKAAREAVIAHLRTTVEAAGARLRERSASRG